MILVMPHHSTTQGWCSSLVVCLFVYLHTMNKSYARRWLVNMISSWTNSGVLMFYGVVTISILNCWMEQSASSEDKLWRSTVEMIESSQTLRLRGWNVHNERQYDWVLKWEPTRDWEYLPMSPLISIPWGTTTNVSNVDGSAQSMWCWRQL